MPSKRNRSWAKTQSFKKFSPSTKKDNCFFLRFTESSKAGYSPLGYSTFFGTLYSKTLRQVKNPMRKGADREKSWKSSIVCFPFSPFGNAIFRGSRMVFPKS
ncbi:hypothetical protein AVEN_80452-1 [Araneus ventricosus]|uniref:Uncharacterized protein n=1 Tax=Araneus ventricosus TaxID=182803 RepID=A0A4Y2H995_ARAVE|nr:hypothetical protein AVEN_80452-1 [Araneus ventricosus]